MKCWVRSKVGGFEHGIIWVRFVDPDGAGVGKGIFWEEPAANEFSSRLQEASAQFIDKNWERSTAGLFEVLIDELLAEFWQRGDIKPEHVYWSERKANGEVLRAGSLSN